MSTSPIITLYTAKTPNGFPISIILEELGVSYDWKFISFAEKEQRSDWFLKINPNGRIPAIVDHKRGDFPVFETSAILLYLAQHYDPEHKISYDPVTEPDLYSEEIQWMFFTHGGVAPMGGQAAHFLRYAPEKIPYAIKRYVDEVKRLFEVIEKRLEGREWLVGPHYSLADIKTFPWIRIGPWMGVAFEEYPNIRAWLARCHERPKTDVGLGIPLRWNLEEQMANESIYAAEARANFNFKA